MRFRFMPLALLLALAPAAQAHDRGWEGHRNHRTCWERERHDGWSRWEARRQWEAREAWERRHRCDDEWRFRRECRPGWEREAWVRVPAPSFHVRIQLP